MVRPIYDRSGDPKNLTRQSANTYDASRDHTCSTPLLHVVLTVQGPTVYIYIYAISNFTSIMINAITIALSIAFLEKRNLFDLRATIDIGILRCSPFPTGLDSPFTIQSESFIWLYVITEK